MAKKSKNQTIKMLSPENYFRQKVRTLPIHQCFLNDDWNIGGMAYITITRKHSNGNFSIGSFLVDLKCLGVKDADWKFNLHPIDYEKYINKLTEFMSFSLVDYALVHNIIYESLTFAEDIGLKPAKDFQIAKFILEEDDDHIEEIEIECGQNGMPCYMPSPEDSAAEVQRILSTLDSTIGKDNYLFNMESYEEIDEDSIYDEDDDFDDDFDENPSLVYFDKSEVEGSKLFQFKITLIDSKDPVVWRRVLVPSYYYFSDFHSIIQIIFGWDNYHEYFFSPKGYGSFPMIDMEGEDILTEVISKDNRLELNSKHVKLSDIFKKKNQIFAYIYDMGDDWHHEIVLEKIIDEEHLKPQLIDGEGNCPPEDCGGIYAYNQIREILNDPNNPSFNSYKENYYDDFFTNKEFHLTDFQESLASAFNAYLQSE